MLNEIWDVRTEFAMGRMSVKGRMGRMGHIDRMGIIIAVPVAWATVFAV